jgi:L-alanine-DL-glutamate epimerase-like enolase superfamily enzyme
MKITDIKCYVLPYVPQHPGFHWRAGLNMGIYSADYTSYSAIMRVETDEGYVGHAGGGGYRFADVVRRYLKPEFVGIDPLMTEHIWHRMWELHRLGLQELVAMDLACWDIKSQAAKLPLYQILGGNNPKVPAYASTVTWDTMEEYERHIKECCDEGFFAFKLHATGDAKWDAQLSHNLRTWVGDDADLMFDASGGWDYVTSLWFGRQLEEANFLWYEEPMREYDLPSYAELCASLDIPILGAETCEGAHWNMATWIQQRALDMVRISAGKGGYTGALKIAHMAESFGMRAQVHGADPHLCAAVPNNDYCEILVINTEQIKELKVTGAGQPRVVDGYITVSNELGTGPQPDWAEIERKAVLIV